MSKKQTEPAKSAKHTPGPWSVRPKVGHQIPVASAAMEGLLVNLAHVTNIRDGEGVANAHLFAAAPESHACNVELAAIVREMCRVLGVPEPVDSLARSDAAIAKATGGEI